MRFAAEPDRAHELTLILALLRRRDAGVAFDRWRRSVGRLLHAGAAGGAYAAALDASWPGVCASFQEDVCHRAETLVERGIGPTLAGLYPGTHWRGSVLEIETGGGGDVRPGGRGVVLAPSPVWPGPPLVCDDPGRPVRLVYPARTPLPMAGCAAAEDGLVLILGRTRAGVLRSLGRKRCTTELAAAVDISPASASEHAKALRAAALIVSERDGKSVHHRLTRLGARLLAANAASR